MILHDCMILCNQIFCKIAVFPYTCWAAGEQSVLHSSPFSFAPSLELWGNCYDNIVVWRHAFKIRFRSFTLYTEFDACSLPWSVDSDVPPLPLAFLLIFLTLGLTLSRELCLATVADVRGGSLLQADLDVVFDSGQSVVLVCASFFTGPHASFMFSCLYCVWFLSVFTVGVNECFFKVLMYRIILWLVCSVIGVSSKLLLKQCGVSRISRWKFCLIFHQ